MAQLPPRIPNITQDWACWGDEFLEFSSAKRGFHRRSASDSVAFLEAPLLNEDDESTSNSVKDEKEEEAGKDEKLINEVDEVQSQYCKSLTQNPINPATNSNFSKDRVTDPKRVKRILANRQSARRSRVRKLQYITELERSVTSLQAEVSMLSPRVAFLDQQRLLLNVDNSALMQRIAALSQDKIFKDAHQEALKMEIQRLGQLYHQQKHKMEFNAPSPTPTKEASPPSNQKDQKLLYV